MPPWQLLDTAPTWLNNEGLCGGPEFPYPAFGFAQQLKSGEWVRLAENLQMGTPQGIPNPFATNPALKEYHQIADREWEREQAPFSIGPFWVESFVESVLPARHLAWPEVLFWAMDQTPHDYNGPGRLILFVRGALIPLPYPPGPDLALEDAQAPAQLPAVSPPPGLAALPALPPVASPPAPVPAPVPASAPALQKRRTAPSLLPLCLRCRRNRTNCNRALPCDKCSDKHHCEYPPNPTDPRKLAVWLRHVQAGYPPKRPGEN